MESNIQNNADTIICLGRLFFIKKKAIKNNDETVKKLLEELYIYVNYN